MSDPNFFDYLVSVPEVAALLGDRVYPVRAPQDALRPHLVWTRTAVQRQQMYCGVNAVVYGDYQFSCYGSTEEQANGLHIAVRNAMQDFDGLMGDVRVKHCHLNSDFGIEDEDPDIYSVRQLWTICYVET